MNWRSLFFAGFFAGIALGTLWRFDSTILLLLSGVAGILYLVAKLSQEPSATNENNSLIKLVSFVLLIFAISAAWGTRALGPREKYLDQFIGQKIELTGTIVAEPDERETSLRLIFSPDLPAGVEKKAVGKIILAVGKYPAYFYGERLRARGKLEAPENFKTAAGRTFDYQHYLAKDDIYYLINQADIERIGLDESLLVRARAKLFDFKKLFLRRLGRALPEPHNALLSGIAIGAKGLSREWDERFRVVGLSHIVVLSGYNITIVAEAAGKVLRFLPPFAGIFAGGAGVILFTLATGASSTAVRAAIMALVALLARATGRVYQSLDALFLAAFAMVLFQPKILVSDISFQLSFLATLGVIAGPPLIKSYLTWLPAKFALRETATTTLAAQLSVLPWILYKMGNLSLVALPVNLLVLGLVPATMLLGFLVFLLPYPPVTYLAYLLLSYDLLISKFAAKVPFASVNIAYFPLWLTALVYLFYWFFAQNQKSNEKITK